MLSSVGELGRIRGGAELVPWDLDRIADTPYDPTDFQPQLFVAPTFSRAITDLRAWLEDGCWRLRG